MEKKVIVWDLDNTLYRETPEFHELQDELMAQVAIEDLGVDLDFETAKKKVSESYKIYRDGGEYFIQEYGISAKDMFELYHKRKQENLRHMYPYDNFLEKLKSLNCEQYVFSVNPVETSEKMLEYLGQNLESLIEQLRVIIILWKTRLLTEINCLQQARKI